MDIALNTGLGCVLHCFCSTLLCCKATKLITQQTEEKQGRESCAKSHRKGRMWWKPCLFLVAIQNSIKFQSSVPASLKQAGSIRMPEGKHLVPLWMLLGHLPIPHGHGPLVCPMLPLLTPCHLLGYSRQSIPEAWQSMSRNPSPIWGTILSRTDS